jgi:phosphotransferase system  glucose/maltose/N-acetylglucosamine-specific IIC component
VSSSTPLIEPVRFFYFFSFFHLSFSLSPLLLLCFLFYLVVVFFSIEFISGLFDGSTSQSNNKTKGDAQQQQQGKKKKKEKRESKKKRKKDAQTNETD